MVNIPAIITKMADDAKDKFEKERIDVLKALPDELKDFFGTIGFCPGEEDDDDDDQEDKPRAQPYMQPILIVSPYDVPPKPVRDIYWMDAFTKAKRSKAKLKKLDYLVYVYGSDDPDDCYNFLKHDDFVSYEQGKTNGYDLVPPSIASKSESERTESEAKLVRGLKEMKLDLNKAQGDRKHGDPFLERHEKIEAKGSQPSAAKRQKT